MKNISVGVLAGGRSTRMGQNKALLEINGKRFVDRICDELGGFSQVIVSAAKKGDYEDMGLELVYDEHKDIGPIEGIYQVLLHADEEYVFVCAADMPFMSKELVEYMTEFICSDYDCYCMVDDDHVHPLCAIYSKKVLPVITELIEKGRYRLMDILRAVRTKYIRLETTCFDKRALKNINTKEEYVRLVLPVVFCVSGIKDSGKTGLIIKLINEFIKEGYSVAVIKHDGHEYRMDYEGTDTYRFTKAGAVCSAIFSDTQFSINGRGQITAGKIQDMLALRRDIDVFIIEGMKNSLLPKVEVVRKAVSDNIVCDESSLICVATDVVSRDAVGCPVYDINDSDGIFLCVKRFFGI